MGVVVVSQLLTVVCLQANISAAWFKTKTK